ncbi:MAG: hypothetical protein H5U40_09565, partial [Polyangiaceae bacterium]|nr:hypothetical protein [Polyangiaceae bacterium]
AFIVRIGQGILPHDLAIRLQVRPGLMFEDSTFRIELPGMHRVLSSDDLEAEGGHYLYVTRVNPFHTGHNNPDGDELRVHLDLFEGCVVPPGPRGFVMRYPRDVNEDTSSTSLRHYLLALPQADQ